MKFRTIAVIGGLGVAGIALVGVGAAATFTQDTSSSQQITAGKIDLVLSATGANGNGTANITLPNVGPTASTFATTPTEVTITNNGTIGASEVRLQITDGVTNSSSAADKAMEQQTWACLYSPMNHQLLFNEPLSTVVGWGSAAVQDTVAAGGGTDHYTLLLYAGNVDTGCGAPFSGFSGGAITSYEAYTPPAPAFGPNNTAVSLDNSAMGGVVTPKVTVSYQG